MRRCILLAALMAFAGSAAAQGDAVQGLGSIARERERISAQRQQETRRFDAMDADCKTRFAVNDCLGTAQSQRRAMLLELRRQEAILDDAERMQRGQEALRRTEQKAREREDRDAEAASSDGLQSQQERAKEQAEKQERHAEIPMGAASGQKNPAAQPSAGERAATRSAYEAKLTEAKNRKQAAEKRASEKVGSQAPKALPVPP
jgi:hypothetical protein